MSSCICPTGVMLKGCATCQEKVEHALDRLALAEARKNDDGTLIPLEDVAAEHEKLASMQVALNRQLKRWEDVNRHLADM